MDSSDISPSAEQTVDAFVDLEKKEADTKDSGSAETVKVGKNGASKEMGHSILNSVNKSASQIKKPPHRKSSPLNWFPRKKTDTYMKRKIKLLQEVGGMKSSLDETLGDSNPHYSRVEREKIAAREAARKAMEARKAAMVEASWCRILRAARIPSKEAESQLAKAEESVAEVFKEAAAMGVIMHDRPDCPRRPCEVETSSITGGGSTHTVTASFETAFEVDKEVAAAVKTAFIRLANCPNSSNKDEFRELLWKINQNPGTSEANQEISELSSECESDTGSEFEPDSHAAGFSSSSDIANKETRQRKRKKRPLAVDYITKSSRLSAGLVELMLDRLKRLQEEELASLATIVATCGLNAVLLEEESNKQHDSGTINCTVNMPPLGPFMDAQMKKKQAMTELPSLDKVLVKHVSRLEREVRKAKNSRKNDQTEETGKTVDRSDEHINESGLANPSAGTLSEAAPDLGSILLRHTSRLEKEIEEAKNSQRAFEESERYRDVQHIKPDVDNQSTKQSAYVIKLIENIDCKQVDKENIDLNNPSSTQITAQTGGITTRFPPKKRISRIERAKLEALEAFSVCNENNSLDKILVKPMHRLEREKMQALASGQDRAISRDHKKQGTALESLDKVLVKHVSRLEKEKMAVHANEDVVVKAKKDQQLVNNVDSLDKVLVKHVSRLEKEKMAIHANEDVVVKVKKDQQLVNNVESLDKILVKHQSGLEKEKMAVHANEDVVVKAKKDQQLVNNVDSLDKVLVKHVSRLEKEKMAVHANEDVVVKAKKDQQLVNNVDSLDKVLVKHVSRLEKEKMAIHADEDVVVKVKKDQQLVNNVESLDKILVKHQSGLEKDKWAAYQESADPVKHSETRREARERELREAWGGLSLGNSIRPHLSRLERDKAAWKRAEEEEQRRSRELI